MTMTTDEAAGVRTTNKDSYDGLGGDNEREDCNERGGGKDDERDDIVAAVEEMERGETATQEKLWRHFRR